MNMKTFIATCLVALLSGCASKQESVVIRDPETYLSALQSLELDPRKHKSDQKYYDAIEGQMSRWLKQLDNPERLRILFWKCHSASRAKPDRPQDKLEWIDPHSDSLNLIMYRLAEIGSPEAAEVLVDLWCDPGAGWDAHAAEMAGDAVVKCGNPALPFLRERKDSGLNTRLIQLIESGATSGM